jgi:hypothetical protein
MNELILNSYVHKKVNKYSYYLWNISFEINEIKTSVRKFISFSVYSGVGKLDDVLLYRPSDELKRLTINNYKKFLFDSISCLIVTQKSHDLFAKYLYDNLM